MKNRRFVAGERVTVADYSVATFEGYGALFPFDWSRFPAINAYFDRVHALESWARTAPLRATQAEMEEAA